MRNSNLIFLLIFLAFGIFLIFLYFFPAVTFFILLSLSTVYIVGNFIDRVFSKKYRVLVAAVFSFSLYLIIAMFILVLFALLHKLNSINLDFLSSNKYLCQLFTQVKKYLNWKSFSKPLTEIGTYSIIYPVLTFFLLKERIKLKKGALNLIPNCYFEMALNIFYHVNKKLKAYFKGLVIQTAVYSFICSLGSLLIVPKYAIVLGIIGGLSNIIPFFGTIFNYLFLSLVLYIFAGKAGIITGVITVSVAQFADMIVYPLTYSKVLSIPSSLIIISVLLWGKFFGIVGMLISVPLTTLIYANFIEFGRTVKYYTK